MNTSAAQKFVYFFGAGQSEGGGEIKHLVGGKGASLGDLTRAGFKVPPGFTISAECCALYFKANQHWPPGLEQEVRAALTRLEQLTGRSFGRGQDPLLLAVRSGAAQSMPGMMDTVLNVGRSSPGEDKDPWQMLVGAINAVFASWNSERALAYRHHHQIEGLLGTAVTVQVMCSSEVSGVLFTANPMAPSQEQILIEATLGLGEALVLGKVTPDHFVLDRRGPTVMEAVIAAPSTPSLSTAQVVELARLGLRVEEHFKIPCDIEWAWAGGQFYLLQARPIRFRPEEDRAAEREQVRREEIAALSARAEPAGTVWSRYNLSEVLPEPTPMTWALVNWFLSGQGGMGQMYRDLGFRPDARLDQESVFDLVCGRPYCNLSREPLMYSGGLPYEHPFAALKAAPQRALYPRPIRNPARAGMGFWLTLPLRWPFVLARSVRSAFRIQALSRTFAPRFRNEIVPAFLKAVAEDSKRDLTGLDDRALLDLLHTWQKRALFDFARESLKPTVLAALAADNLERLLGRGLGPERARAAVGELSLGVRPDPEADLPQSLRDLAGGRIGLDDFRTGFGHRGPQEMELSQSRWGEDENALRHLAAGPTVEAAPPSDWKTAWERIATEAKLSSLHRAVLTGEVEAMRSYLGLRETGKHHLMRGYALLRRILRQLDARHHLNGGIFYLVPDELPRLTAGGDLSARIAQRRKRRTLALSLEVPQVLFSDDLEAIGRPAPVTDAHVLQGVPLSAGVVEGVALVLTEPTNTPSPAESYILVCPTTDPAWVPLFAKACGLVMETGGVLSHGAVVAREFGLPAVAGLPQIQHRVRSGQRLRVDGGTGRVNILE